MIGTQRMLKTCVLGARINNKRKSHLLDAVEALHNRMSHNVVQQSFWDVYKSEYWVVDNLSFIIHCLLLLLLGLSICEYGSNKSFQLYCHLLLHFFSGFSGCFCKKLCLVSVDDCSGGVDYQSAHIIH